MLHVGMNQSSLKYKVLDRRRFYEIKLSFTPNNIKEIQTFEKLIKSIWLSQMICRS